MILSIIILSFHNIVVTFSLKITIMNYFSKNETNLKFGQILLDLSMDRKSTLNSLN